MIKLLAVAGLQAPFNDSLFYVSTLRASGSSASVLLPCKVAFEISPCFQNELAGDAGCLPDARSQSLGQCYLSTPHVSSGPNYPPTVHQRLPAGSQPRQRRQRSRQQTSW